MIEKAWRMQRETECLSSVSILKAALSLEKKQNEAPEYDSAAVISLHYLVLALRKKEKGQPILREHYVFSSSNCGGGKQSTCWLRRSQRTGRVVWIKRKDPYPEVFGSNDSGYRYHYQRRHRDDSLARLLADLAHSHD